MIIVVGGIKGGSGKTTVATNLAVLRSAKSKDVLLIDADDQETATDFTILRNEQLQRGAGYTSIKLSGSAVRTEVLRLSDKFKDIIIDTGGRDTTSQRAALSVADVLLIPFVPRSFDVWTLEKVSALVVEMKTINPNLNACAFINRADPRGQDNHEAGEVIKENVEIAFINTPLGARKAFSNAASAGLGVTEVKPLDIKAADQMKVLYKYVFNTKMKSVSKGE
jgi:chromosome partitioning protein